MYLVIKAEHAARLAELAERERRRGYPRASSTMARGLADATRWIPWLRRTGGDLQSSTRSIAQEAL